MAVKRPLCNYSGVIREIQTGDTLPVDSAPSDGSVNPVSSGGVFNALAGKQDALLSGTNLKTVNGTSLLGSGNLTVGGDTLTSEGALINLATAKTTPVDADMIGLMDSAASNILKKLSWANVKATLKTYFDTVYPSGSGTSSGTNTGDETPTSIGNLIGSTATAKTTPVDADQFALSDSAATNIVKKFSWLNLKAALKTYFDSLSTTLTNKTLISTTNTFAEVTTTTSSATPSPTGGSRENELYVTALAAGATIAAPSGTPSNGNKLFIRIKDNGTARSLAFNAIYRAIGQALPTTTTVNKTMYIAARYNSADSKWDVVSWSNEV